MPNSNRRTKLAIYICIIFFIMTAVTVIYILSIDDMINGVNVSGISIEGMNKEEAKKHLRDQLHNKLKDRYIKLKYKEDEYVHDYEKLGINYDYDKTIEKIYQDIDTKTNINKIKTFLTGLINERDYDMEYTYDISKLEEFVKSMEKDINSEAQNASVKIDNDRIDIVPEIIGKKVDSDSLKEILINSIGKDSIIDIPVMEKSPTIVEKDIETINSVLGSFVTRYNTSKKNRVNNIVQATNTINNKILMPNEKFSFNKATGVRNSDNGYKKAPVIINGELVPEVGGGVCQVSSTLYNAVLLSGLDILERHNHSLPLSYIGKGRDATVVYDVFRL
ncbi:VanW family protein [Clostridiisalibacter paucivorans]|uniref:VanW family protein n=1 Tax=Clostridiisalibacter paucivorans TaxID=408753 RepID=UPI00047BDDED|nr:VanW family protein [Clostridiisalibacter paucivorans]